ncbi:MAG: phosphoglyceromutase, partial [Pseudoalteromonas sp.]
MNTILKITVLGLLVATSTLVNATQNVVLVTLDGVRWQEVFSGADEALINNADFVKNQAQLNSEFWHKDPKQRQKLLMPFITQTMANKGAIIGDRNNDSKMSVSNPWYFSYPGYNEILTGTVDENINSNDKN